jgi:hypothetical protein
MSAIGPSDGTETLYARCRSRTGLIVELEVLDISPFGFMVDRRTWSVRQDERILVKFPELAFLPATVLWVEDDKAGLVFERPLYEPVLDHMMRQTAARRRRA